MKNVLEYLERTVLENEKKIAIVEEEKKCTYLELLQTSKRVGSELSNYVIPRQPIPILMEKGINALYSFLGIVYAGGFYILLNPELPISRLKKILEILETNVILTDENNIELAQEIGINKIILKQRYR